MTNIASWNFIATEIHKILYEFAEIKMHLTAWNYITVKSIITILPFSLSPLVWQFCCLENIAKLPSEILKFCFASLSDLHNSRVTLFKVSWVAIVVFLTQSTDSVNVSQQVFQKQSISEITMPIILRIISMQLSICLMASFQDFKRQSTSRFINRTSLTQVQ